MNYTPEVLGTMLQILIGSILLSTLHALLPNHWLPLLAIGRKEHWSVNGITWISFLCGIAHAVSTILIGLLLGFVGWKLSVTITQFAPYIAPAVLFMLGVYFIWQHHRHHHFHMNGPPEPVVSKARIIGVLTITMFFSPCLEIEGYFLVAGSHGTAAVFSIALIYAVLSITGMVLWIRWVFQKSMKLNWHRLEHNAGIITGITLMITGVITFFVS